MQRITSASNPYARPAARPTAVGGIDNGGLDHRFEGLLEQPAEKGVVAVRLSKLFALDRKALNVPRGLVMFADADRAVDRV
jgi:hypothetical protein